MISTFTALIDSNVFYGARLRSLVLFVAQTKLFRARWSEFVHDEWVRNLVADRPDLTPENLIRTREAMNAAVPECIVTGYEPLMAGIELPDPDDRHIVAAAILARADVIVTFNERDFPAETLTLFGLRTSHPDEFLLEALSLGPELFIDAVRDDFLHYGKPPLMYEQYLGSLAKAGVPKMARALEAYAVLMVPDIGE